jgi:hypothetical protein
MPGERPVTCGKPAGGEGRRLSVSCLRAGCLIRFRQPASPRVKRGCRGGQCLKGCSHPPPRTSRVRATAGHLYLFNSEASHSSGPSEVKTSAVARETRRNLRQDSVRSYWRAHSLLRHARFKSGHDEGGNSTLPPCGGDVGASRQRGVNRGARYPWRGSRSPPGRRPPGCGVFRLCGCSGGNARARGSAACPRRW